MALTTAERQRRYRERKAERQKQEKDAAGAFIRRSFAEFFSSDAEDDGEWLGFEQVALYAGLDTPDLAKDEWPEFDQYGLRQFDFENTGSLGRAEMLAGAMQEGLRVLTDKLNRFKRREITARIEELESGDLVDPSQMKHALNEIVELRRILARLDKPTRLTFPSYEIKG